MEGNSEAPCGCVCGAELPTAMVFPRLSSNSNLTLSRTLCASWTECRWHFPVSPRWRHVVTNFPPPSLLVSFLFMKSLHIFFWCLAAGPTPARCIPLYLALYLGWRCVQPGCCYWSRNSHFYFRCRTRYRDLRL